MQPRLHYPRSAQHGRLIPWLTHQLKPKRQTFSACPDRQADRGPAEDVKRRGERDRAERAERRRDIRLRWRAEQIDALEDRGAAPTQRGASLLGAHKCAWVVSKRRQDALAHELAVVAEPRAQV